MPEKIQKLDDLSSMTVFEAVELAQRLEEKWGVSALVAGSAAGPVTSLDAGRTRRSTPPSARELVRQPVTDFRREAEIIGVSVAPEPDLSMAEAIVEKIAESAADLFPDQAAVRTFLFDNPIDGSGKTAVELVQERGATALLIKLDQMRFGANG